MGLESFPGLLGMQQHRVTGDQIPVVHESWCEAFHQWYITSDDYPSFAVTPTPAISVTQGIA
ncbi:hypothetical protein BvRS1_28200 [Burkholderia vietnamiensis]|nr:hypothetical protein BvRS1_28200 [Burkholderia vietnamiensis]